MSSDSGGADPSDSGGAVSVGKREGKKETLYQYFPILGNPLIELIKRAAQQTRSSDLIERGGRTVGTTFSDSHQLFHSF